MAKGKWNTLGFLKPCHFGDCLLFSIPTAWAHFVTTSLHIPHLIRSLVSHGEQITALVIRSMREHLKNTQAASGPSTSFFLIKIFFIVIQLQLYAFSPRPSTPPQLNPPPSPTSTLPLDFVHVSFIVVPENPSPTIPSPLPPAIVRLFLTSMSLVIFCFLFFSIYYVPVKGEIIWLIFFS